MAPTKNTDRPLAPAQTVPEALCANGEGNGAETMQQTIVAGGFTADAVTDSAGASAVRQAVFFSMRDSLGRFPGLIAPGHNLFCGATTDDTAPVGTFARATPATFFGHGGLLSSAAAGRVRRDWAADGTLLGWLIEPQAMNALKNSEQLSEKSWIKSGSAILAKSAAAPNGTISADKFVEDKSPKNFHRVIQLLGTTLSAPLTLSYFLRKAERSRLRFCVFNAGATQNYISADINLDDQTVQAGHGGTGFSTAARLLDCGNGWYRASLSGIIDGTAQLGIANLQLRLRDGNGAEVYSGDGRSGLYLWGGQAEGGSLSSYMPTCFAPVVRAGDVWTVILTTSWFRQTAGTLFLWARAAADAPAAGAVQVLAQYDDGTAGNLLRVVREPDRSLRCIVATSGVEVANLNLGPVADQTTFRMAFAWDGSGFCAVRDGGTCLSGTAARLPDGLTTHRLGSDCCGQNQWSGHVLHDAYFPVALPDTQLQVMTAQDPMAWPV